MKKILISDTAMKIYSVLFAILLWIFVVYNQNPESTKYVSGVAINYTNASDLENNGLVILKQESDPSVDVGIKGRRMSIGKVDASNISASATIPEIQAGEYDVSVDVRLPINEVSVVDKKPYTVKVIVEKIKTMQVPVEIKYTGSPEEKNTSVQASPSPQSISVWGPESVISTISHATATLDVSKISDGESVNCAYKIISADGKDITGNPNIRTSVNEISVSPSVYATKDIKITAEYISEIPEGYSIVSIDILPSTIQLGSKEISDLEKIEEIKTRPIDLSNITSNTKVTAKLVIPENLVNIFSVTEVEVAINVEQKENRTYAINKINFENAESTNTYTAENLPIEVVVSGSKKVLDTYNPRASVDVSGLSDGIHNVSLKLDTPEGVKLSGDYTINVLVSSPSSTALPQ